MAPISIQCVIFQVIANIMARCFCVVSGAVQNGRGGYQAPARQGFDPGDNRLAGWCGDGRVTGRATLRFAMRVSDAPPRHFFFGRSTRGGMLRFKGLYRTAFPGRRALLHYRKAGAAFSEILPGRRRRNAGLWRNNIK